MNSRYIPVINIIETFLPTVVFYLYDLEFLDRGKKTKVSQFYISRFPLFLAHIGGSTLAGQSLTFT